MTFNSRRAMPRTASGAGDVRAAGESPVPLRADPFNGAGGVMAGRDRCPRSPEPHIARLIERLGWQLMGYPYNWHGWRRVYGLGVRLHNRRRRL